MNDPMNGWIQIHDADPYGRDDKRDTFVRAWKPGDGLSCSNVRSNSKTPCGKPVAVSLVRPSEMEIERSARRGWGRLDPPRTRTLCAIHLTSFFSGAFHLDRAAAEKAAQEELCAKYWEQYEKLLELRTESMKQERLETLPEGVRALIESSIADGSIWSSDGAS